MEKIKINNVMSKIDKSYQPGLEVLKYIFIKYGYELRIAGGPVRDILIGIVPHDLDFATTATPHEMKYFFNKEGIRMINTKGEDHGTITVRIDDCNFECTTLRIDKTTDGRHAEVEFIADWERDAKRRDLTINAMYLGFDGTIYDYCNGREHLKNRHVTFVGNASKRIQEDYLRIIRYFRFFGRINESGLHDENVVQSIKENVDGLSLISGERIFTELKKIIAGRRGNEMIAKMKECGIFPYIGLKETFNLTNFNEIYARCNIPSIREVSILTAGILTKEDAATFIARVKCSKKDKNTIFFIIEHRNKEFSDCQILSLLIDLKYKENMEKSIMHELVGELLLYNGLSKEKVKHIVLPCFPVTGMDLVDVPKEDRKKKIKELIDIWKNSNYNMSLSELITSL